MESYHSSVLDLLFETDVKYRDFDLRMITHPQTNRLIPLKEENAVKRALYNLIMTEPGERPFNHLLGVPLNRILFENDTNSLAVHNLILEAIERFEPRVKVKNIDLKHDSDEQTVIINLTFEVIKLKEEVELTIYLQRTK